MADGTGSAERRLAGRRTPAVNEPLARVRLRGGRELTVIDVAQAGALVEGTTRLLPGTHVDVHVVTSEGRVLVRGRVVRAHVCAVEADLIRYRAGIAFDQPIDASVRGNTLPGTDAGGSGGAGSPYPVDRMSLPQQARETVRM